MHVSQHSIDPCLQGWGHLNQRRKVCVVSDVPSGKDVSIKGGKFVLSQLRLTGIHRHTSAPPSNAAREQGSAHPSVVLWEWLSVRVWALSPGWEAFYQNFYMEGSQKEYALPGSSWLQVAPQSDNTKKKVSEQEDRAADKKLRVSRLSREKEMYNRFQQKPGGGSSSGGRRSGGLRSWILVFEKGQCQWGQRDSGSSYQLATQPRSQQIRRRAMAASLKYPELQGWCRCEGLRLKGVQGDVMKLCLQWARASLGMTLARYQAVGLSDDHHHGSEESLQDHMGVDI